MTLPRKLFWTLLTLPALSSALLGAERSNASKLAELKEREAGNPLTGDTWLLAAWDKICGWAKAAWEWLSTNVHTMLIQDMGMGDANLVALLVMLAIITVMLASGAWAASIAQMRRHNGLPYFFLGLVTFFVGPVYLLFTLEIKGEKEQLERFAQDAAKKRAEEEERKQKEAMQARERGQEVPAVSAEGVVWNKDYFASIQRKDDGSPNGPWKATYNGVTVRVEEILDALDECLQARIVNQEGATITGRIPYSRLQAWEPLALTPEEESARAAAYDREVAAKIAADAAMLKKAGILPEEVPAQEEEPAGQEQAPADASQGPVWNQEYFEALRQNPDGPWKVRYNDVEVRVDEIQEVLKECIQVRFTNLEGASLVGRIPYARMQEWVSLAPRPAPAPRQEEPQEQPQ